MTDLLKTVKNVRDVIQKLNDCKDYIINKQKKAEMERLITELRLLEDSLLVRNPLTSINLTSAFPPSDTSSINSMKAPSISQFRIFAEQKNLTSFPEIKQAAIQQGLNPTEAANSVMKMQQARTRAEIEALAANILPDVRAKLYGRNFSEVEFRTEVKRIVQSNTIVSTELVDPVSELIVQQFIR